MAREYQSGRRDGRDEDEGGHGREFPEYDYRYTRNDEGDSSVRAGSYDQGRVQYGRRNPRDLGRDPYGGHRSESGEGRYGQSNFGDRQHSANYRDGQGEDRYGGDDYGASRQGGYGGDYGRGRYGPGGSLSRFETEARGRGSPRRDDAGENYGYGHGGAAPVQRGTGLHRGKGPKGYQRSDQRLQEMICERLSEDPDIDASEVSVQVQSGLVTLEGSVDSRRTKYLVEDVAEQLGVEDVQNNLRVQRAGPMAAPGLSGEAQGSQARGEGVVDQSRSKQH